MRKNKDIRNLKSVTIAQDDNPILKQDSELNFQSEKQPEESQLKERNQKATGRRMNFKAQAHKIQSAVVEYDRKFQSHLELDYTAKIKEIKGQVQNPKIKTQQEQNHSLFINYTKNSGGKPYSFSREILTPMGQNFSTKPKKLRLKDNPYNQDSCDSTCTEDNDGDNQKKGDNEDADEIQVSHRGISKSKSEQVQGNPAASLLQSLKTSMASQGMKVDKIGLITENSKEDEGSSEDSEDRYKALQKFKLEQTNSKNQLNLSKTSKNQSIEKSGSSNDSSSRSSDSQQDDDDDKRESSINEQSSSSNGSNSSNSDSNSENDDSEEGSGEQSSSFNSSDDAEDESEEDASEDNDIKDQEDSIEDGEINLEEAQNEAASEQEEEISAKKDGEVHEEAENGDDQESGKNESEDDKDDKEKAKDGVEKVSKKPQSSITKMIKKKDNEIKENFSKIFYEEPQFAEMIVFCSQSYQIIRCYKELQNLIRSKKATTSVEHEKFSKQAIIEELRIIGKKADFCKALIYAINEVEYFPPRKFQKALNSRIKARNNYLISAHCDNRPLFTGYVGDKTNQFSKRYNSFTLFMLNNSQDELLMAYTDFCRKFFSAGLPDQQTSALPEKFTNLDIKDLRAFISSEDILSEPQFRLAIARNLDDDKIWKKLNEKDNDGVLIRHIKFEELLPFIILGFYCYVTNEVDESLNRIAHEHTDGQRDAHSSHGQNKEKISLAACFAKAGLTRQDWNKPAVTYSMTENALLFYMDNQNLNRDQVELILRMVRERMQVHQMIRSEQAKEYFDHKLPRKSFGRWLMAEIALQKRLNKLAQEQYETMAMNREKFKRQLVYEEKMTQIAINIDKLDYTRFIKLVTKNLMIIIHARKKFGAYLDLQNHDSVKEALMALIQLESDKAKDIIKKEYNPQANEKNIQAKRIEEILAQKDNDNNGLLGQLRSKQEKKIRPSQGQFKEWEKSVKTLQERRKLMEEEASVQSIYKLFKTTMWQTYWHSFFIGDKKQKNNRAPDLTNPEYNGPSNLWHFTIHEFNEALYFAMKEFSLYVNFAQIENATCSFILDDILREKKQKKNSDNKQAIYDDWLSRKNEAEKAGHVFLEDEPKERKLKVKQTYPLLQDDKLGLEYYSKIFVKEYNSKDIFNKPKKEQYQDNLLQKNVSEHLRFRDLEKILILEPMSNALQTEVEVFRGFKLCDLEFTRYAYQILVDEAHRQALQTMTLMFLSSPRCKYSHRREEIIHQKSSDTDSKRYILYYKKLIRNNFIKKKELSQIRESFREERIKRIRATRTKQRKDQDAQILAMDAALFQENGEFNDQFQLDMDVSDIYHPMNLEFYKRFETWQHNKDRMLVKLAECHKLYGINTWDSTIHLDQKDSVARSKLIEEVKEIRRDLDSFYGDKKQVPSIETGQDDMVNILLTMNYLTGFASYLHEASDYVVDKELDAINQDDEDLNNSNEDSVQSQEFSEDGSDDDALVTMRKKYTFLNSAAQSRKDPLIQVEDKDNSLISESLTVKSSVFTKSQIMNGSKNHLKNPESAVNISTIKKAVERPKFKFNNKINEKNVVNDLFREDSEASDNDSDDNRRKKKKKKSSKSRKSRRSDDSRSIDSRSNNSRQSHSRGRRVKEGDGIDHHHSRHSSSGKRAKEGNSPRQFSNSLGEKARQMQKHGPQIIEEQIGRQNLAIPDAIVDHQEIQIEDKTGKRKHHGKSSSSKRDKRDSRKSGEAKKTSEAPATTEGEPQGSGCRQQ